MQEDADAILTENSDFLDQESSNGFVGFATVVTNTSSGPLYSSNGITFTLSNCPTPTPTVTPTQTSTPTQTPTPSITPSASPIPSGTTEANNYLTAVVNAGGTGIDSTVSAATRTLFTSLVSNGLYQKITAMYPLLGASSASCKFNAKNPVDTDAAYRLTFNGGWSFSSSGATGNNANTYARTYLTGSTLNAESTHQSYYVGNNTSSSSCIEMGASNPPTYTEFATCTSAFGGNYRTYNINTVGLGVDSLSHTAMTGYFIASRTSSSTNYLYKNGSLNYSGTTATNGTIDYDIYIGARNDAGTASSSTDRRASFVTIGSGLTPSEITTLASIVNDWATSIQRNTY